ncbi:unnamed protein product [Prorocentrum cordatum]|uniref:Protein HIRA n=1 Tax=Prorocentrum cordatum TaxID=2364126 RepID=A0ABN9T631_9DINO|nr:unnamed protein product [Polarella glacialis]
MPCRSRSLMQASKPVTMTYTSSGDWLVLGFEAGQMQIWNASSLMLEKTLSAHCDMVTSIVSSPASAGYDPRIVSCSKDQTLRLWRPVVGSWLLEQHSHEPRSGHFGVRSLSFSSDGMWLASVATELCVWRVRVARSVVSLELHQYLEAVCGSEGLRIAVFSVGGGIVAGSKDGVLGLWMKAEGRPDFLLGRDDEKPPAPLEHGAAAGPSPWTPGPRAKPMHRLSPQGIRPMRPLEQIASGWSAMASPAAAPRTLRPCVAVSRPTGQTHGLASAGRLAVSRPQSRGATPVSPVPPIPSSPASALAPSLSSPTLLGARSGLPGGRAGAAGDCPAGGDFEAALKRLCSEAATPPPPPRRNSLARVAIVKRISLEPEAIAG